MAPHRSNRKGDLGNYRPVSSAADIDNIFLTEEGWVYRHFKGNPRDPKTRYWDEIIVSGQVDRDEERPSRNPIDYGTVIDNEPMLDTLNATPRKYLGLGDTSDANSVDGYESDGVGYGTDGIEFETVIDGVSRVIGATDGCFDYDYKHGTCLDDGGGGGDPGLPDATGRVSINLIQITTGDIKVGDDVTFEVQVILEDGATNCDWKVAVVTNTRFSGELATGSTNESTTERFTVPATTAGIFTIQAIAIAEDTAGEELLDTDILTGVEVTEDLPEGSCLVQILNGPIETEYGLTVVVNAHHEMLDGATFDGITIDGSHPYAITNLVTTTSGDDTEFEFTAGIYNYDGTRDLTVTVSGFDSQGNDITCTDTTSMTVHPEPIFRFEYENQWVDGYTPSPGDKFDIKVESTFLSHVDRSTTDYYVQGTTGDISVVKKVDTDRSGVSDVTIFEATVGASANGPCSIHFRGNAKSSPLGDVTREWNDTDNFTVNGVIPVKFYQYLSGTLSRGTDFTTQKPWDYAQDLTLSNNDQDILTNDFDPFALDFYNIFVAEGSSVSSVTDYTYDYTDVFSGNYRSYKGNDGTTITYDGLTILTRDSHPDLDYFDDPEVQVVYAEKYLIDGEFSECYGGDEIEFWYDATFKDSEGNDVAEWSTWRDKVSIDDYTAYQNWDWDGTAQGQVLLDHTGLPAGTEFRNEQINVYFDDMYVETEPTSNTDEVQAIVDSIDASKFTLEYEEGADSSWETPVWHTTVDIDFKSIAPTGGYFQDGSYYLEAIPRDEVPGRDVRMISFGEERYDDGVLNGDKTEVTKSAKLTVRYFNDNDYDNPDDTFVIKAFPPVTYSCIGYQKSPEPVFYEFRIEPPTHDDLADVQEYTMTIWGDYTGTGNLPSRDYGDHHEIFDGRWYISDVPEHPWNNFAGEMPFVVTVNYDESTLTEATANLKFNDFKSGPFTLYKGVSWNMKGDLSELSYVTGSDNYVTVWNEPTGKRVKINIDYYKEDRLIFGGPPGGSYPYKSNTTAHPRAMIDLGSGYEEFTDNFGSTMVEGQSFKVKIEVDFIDSYNFEMQNVRLIGSVRSYDYDTPPDKYGEVTTISQTINDTMLVGEFECTMPDTTDRTVQFMVVQLFDKVKPGEDTIKVAYPTLFSKRMKS